MTGAANARGIDTRQFTRSRAQIPVGTPSRHCSGHNVAAPDRMAPTDRIQLPFRWQFVPVHDPRDSSVRWMWQAYTQAGKLVLKSDRSFDTLIECIDDARAKGYGGGPL